MTEEERERILAEIDELAGVSEKRPGDVSIPELRDRWGVTSAAVVNRMRRLVETGLYVTLLVFDPKRRRSCRVYRRAERKETPGV
jgi:predicted ArsR family transcriptional regulator